LWSSPRCLESAGSLLCLLEILIARAPEEQAAGHTADGHGDPKLGGHTKDAVFRGGWACTVSGCHAHGLI
jgi:hypothetical protein